MFCPKCGTQNVEEAKFCRSCGMDVSTVSNALTGKLPPQNFYIDKKGRMKSNDPDELWAAGLKNVIGGFGFLVIALALLITGVAGGHAWWWAMLFPAFGMLSGGISQLSKVNRIAKRNRNGFPVQQNQIQSAPFNPSLPPPNPATEYIPPVAASRPTFFESPERYKTGELVNPPPSITENTTRHLEINKEGETMALPRSEN